MNIASLDKPERKGVLIQYEGSIRVEKTKEELESYFKKKIEVFKSSVMKKQLEFENKKEYLLDKALKVTYEKVITTGNDIKIVKFYENGVIEYVLNEFTKFKVKIYNKFSYRYFLMDMN